MTSSLEEFKEAVDTKIRLLKKVHALLQEHSVSDVNEQKESAAASIKLGKEEFDSGLITQEAYEYLVNKFLDAFYT